MNLTQDSYNLENYRQLFPQVIKNYVDGDFIISKLNKTSPIFTPVTGEIISQVCMSEEEDLINTITKISPAQEEWAKLTLKKRVAIIYNYRNLLIAHRDKLAFIIHLENGKCLTDAYAEIDKAVETVEFACSLPNIATGRFAEVSNNVWCFSEFRPLGIVASITPFNFPIMVPHWTIAQAIALGNAVILKPSEQTPIASHYIANLWAEAGLPKGVFNILNGGKEIVNALCKNKEVKALSFVGSTVVAEKVYLQGSQTGKRILALGGAKNYIIIMDDINNSKVVQDIVSSAFGMVGQRCMAASVLLTVGTFHLENELINYLNKMKIEPNIDFSKGLSPVANPHIRKEIEDYLVYAKSSGAKILVDGTKFKINNPAYEKGFYIGPTLIDWRGCEEKMQDKEIFGPVLEIIGAKDLSTALAMQQNSPYGNAAAIFTDQGETAFNAIKNFHAGMLGINIGVPVPREPFSFAGTKLSKFGQGEITGEGANYFWCNYIKITMKWNRSAKKDWLS